MPPVKRRSYTASYTASYKLDVIKYAEEHGNHAAGRHSDIGEKLCRDWRKQKGKLQGMRKSKKADRGSKPRWAQVEDILEDWVIEQRSSCRGVSTCQLRLKANVIASDLDVAGFRGGPLWIGRFLKRKSLALRARTTCANAYLPIHRRKWTHSDYL